MEVAEQVMNVQILGVTYELKTRRGMFAPIHFVTIDGTNYDIQFPQIPDLLRERGNKAKIYDAYLIDWSNKNPGGVILPNIINYHGADYRDFAPALEGAEEIDRRGLCLRPHRFPTSRKQLKDGRVIEETCDTRGIPMFAIFPSLKHANNYKKPQDWKEYFNEW
jgi:hypothetical protein